MIAEDIVLQTKKGNQLKAFSLISSFSKEIIDLHANNPEIIEDYLQRSANVMRDAKEIILRAQKIMPEENSEQIIALTKILIDLFFEVSYWKHFISALSSRLYKYRDLHRDMPNIFEKISSWKNNTEFYNFESNSLIEISHFISCQRNFHVQGWEIVKYLHIKEFFDFLDRKLIDRQLFDLIRQRERLGYISLNLDHPEYENMLLCNSTPEAKEIKKHVDSIFRDANKKQAKKNIIQGQIIIKSNEIIQGKCIVIENERHLSDKINLDGMILVTTMSTPGFIPYIKNVLAIITDTGGITSHAAITARELNIPCIVGTNVATTFLKTGDLVEMNMRKGIIRIIRIIKKLA